ncbi:MAG: DUF945 domain-containing protein [Planctomycetota bacterium]|nr:DUF945 domain-containing protein [Planctomycetota bacterium]
MLMLSKATEINRRDLGTIRTPAPTDTWRPVPHLEVVETLLHRAEAKGLRVANERYAVLDGALYPQPGVQVSLKGARMFGSLDFEPIRGLQFPAGCTPSAGIRNSHDKSFALSILSGARVLVCANGVLSAEYVISRKHTSGLDLEVEVDRALDAFIESTAQFHATYERLRGKSLTKARSHHLVVELARAGAISSSDILPVVQEFEQPRHPEFRDRNAWTLYQAATERMKQQSPARQVDGFKALNSVLHSLVN